MEIPITILYKKSLFKQDGTNPVWLTGYGSVGSAMLPYFDIMAISLVDRGFIYAITHVRGGGDLGLDWHRSAKFLNKKRTFQDFIACAEKLIADKYTSKGNIIIYGKSAGGLLIGTVINEKPELFRAAILDAPFVDVLNTMLDENLPLVARWFKEIGNPKEKKYYDYIKSYCPYYNIKNTNYPHIMVTTSLNDSRVPYWEPAKWVARLRAHKTDNNIIILKTNIDSSHAGKSGVSAGIYDKAEKIAFALHVFGM